MSPQLLPDANPSYLRVHYNRLAEKPDSLKEFINNALENKDYPTMKDYKRKQKILAQQKLYTTDFVAEEFLEVIPYPENYFSEKKPPRKPDDYAYH